MGQHAYAADMWDRHLNPLQRIILRIHITNKLYGSMSTQYCIKKLFDANYETNMHKKIHESRDEVILYNKKNEPVNNYMKRNFDNFHNFNELIDNI